MREKIRLALRVATGLAVVWVLCMFVPQSSTTP